MAGAIRLIIEMKNEIYMKKVFLSLAAMFMIALAGQAQTVDQLFAKYAKEKGTVKVSIGKMGMMFASLFEDTMGVDGLDVLSFEDCTDAFRNKMNAAINSLNDNKYELLLTAKDDGENVKILVRNEKDVIRELVVMVSGNDVALVRIRGNIKHSDLDRVINRHK
jgi:hypothetical protein